MMIALPTSSEAYIIVYETTYGAMCLRMIFDGVCP
jgi:Protein of unknown function (DUF1272).